MGFVIADDSDENVDQSIVFGGEALIPSPEEAKINDTNLDFHPSCTVLAINEEEEYLQ